MLPIIPPVALQAIRKGVVDGNPISDLEFIGLSIRVIQQLNKNGIIAMEDLMQWTPEMLLFEIDSFGEKSLIQLFEVLARYHELDQIKAKQIDPKILERIRVLGG